MHCGLGLLAQPGDNNPSAPWVSQVGMVCLDD